MEISSAEFVSSSTSLSACPPPRWPEYAFIGRSNVGKSSLINAITQRKGLAKTSQTPGKTQCINHFIINREGAAWYLVDLPGYGYAKTSKKLRESWQGFIHSYILKRESLLCVFVLIDSRHEPQENDLAFMRWLGTSGIPFAMVFTKTDKLSETALGRNYAHYENKMLEEWTSMPPVILSSAETGRGKEEILALVTKANASFIPPR
jgi:GTP-binding protein